MGDGLTGTGQGGTQVFIVPDGATRLFFGFIDFYTTAMLVPGWYGDNSGGIQDTIWVNAGTTAVEATSWGQVKALFR